MTHVVLSALSLASWTLGLASLPRGHGPLPGVPHWCAPRGWCGVTEKEWAPGQASPVSGQPWPGTDVQEAKPSPAAQVSWAVGSVPSALLGASPASGVCLCSGSKDMENWPSPNKRTRFRGESAGA